MAGEAVPTRVTPTRIYNRGGTSEPFQKNILFFNYYALALIIERCYYSFYFFFIFIVFEMTDN